MIEQPRPSTNSNVLPPTVIERVQRDAIARVEAAGHAVELFMGPEVRHAGEVIGPPIQKIVLDRAAALVFADDVPGANFGHRCRYFLYHPQDGAFEREIVARYPPYAQRSPEDFKPFFEIVGRRYKLPRHLPVSAAKPVTSGYGRRFAILYSGLPYLRHLNELELSYRMLTGQYGFEPNDIQVLYYDGVVNADGSLNTVSGPSPPQFPGQPAPSPYLLGQHPISAGTVENLHNVFSSGQLPLAAQDLLFIHMTGDGDIIDGDAYVSAFDGVYWATDIAADLPKLAPHRALLVLMAQCSSGGFNESVVTNSPAVMTSIASAAQPGLPSYFSDGVPAWDYFAPEWISAHLSLDAISAKAVGLGPPALVTADEAYAYALANDSADTPAKLSGASGGTITMA